MRTAFGLELRRMRMLVIWSCAISLVYVGIIGLMYPIFRDNSAAIDDYMALFPKELMAAFGLVGSLSNPGVLFNTYIGSMLWPILATLVGVVLATRPAGDLERGFLELPLATRLPRVRYLAAAIAAQLVSLTLLAVATVGGTWLAGRLVGAPFEADRFALAGGFALAFGAAIAAVATLLAVVLLDRGRAAGITAGIVIGMYLLQIVASVKDIGPIAELSAFRHARFQELIDTGAVPAGDLALFVVVAVAAWAAALFAFRRRDLAA